MPCIAAQILLLASLLHGKGLEFLHPEYSIENYTVELIIKGDSEGSSISR